MSQRDETRTLIDDLLDEQQHMSMASCFSQWHDDAPNRGQAASFQRLLPLAHPKPGEQYAFEVNLDQCSGCKACVPACHALNGLDEGEAWREVGLLLSDHWRHPFQQTITTACHHCVDPGCLNGCPVLAYEKDPRTGIVRHLDDQCIGCQYCILKCPYEVPKYAPARGIVRKCDMCSQRLATGEAPACVQACPNEAIRITLVNQAGVTAAYRPKPGSSATAINLFLPASPPPALTLPTTRFISKKPLSPDLIPASADAQPLQPPHWPLVWMLTLTQAGVGALALALLVAPNRVATLAWVAMAMAAVGVVASVAHLGRPLKAWRAFLGFRTSWLSREILVFGAFLGLGFLGCLLVSRPAWLSRLPMLSAKPVLLLATISGLAGVFCSGMVYHDTRRPFWLGWRSLGRFCGTTAWLGLSTAWLVAAAHPLGTPWLPWALAVVALIKLSGEHRLLRHAEDAVLDMRWPTPDAFERWSLARSGQLLWDRLGQVTRGRYAAGILGGLGLPLASLLPTSHGLWLAAVAFGLSLGGEMAERYLFFRCVVPPRMPVNV